MRWRASGLEKRPFSLWAFTLLLHGGLLPRYDPHRQPLRIAAVMLQRGAGLDEALRRGVFTSTWRLISPPLTMPPPTTRDF